ncbi:MAG: substrate-binding domain-containing protein, partial [Promethearchaeota archaeon]
VAIIVPNIIELGWLNPFYSLILENIEEKLESRGINLKFLSFKIDNPDSVNKIINKIRSNHFHGIFIVGNIFPKELIRQFLNFKIPIVAIDGPLASKLKFNNVLIDDIKGSEMIVQYLIDKGHRDIAYIGCSIKNRASKFRLQGYKNALEKNNIKINKKLIVLDKIVMMNFESGFNSAEKLIKSKENFTAIFGANDSIAIGCIQALKGFNLKIPDDVSVVGFDNIEMSKKIDPPLTTLNVPREKIAKKSVEIMLKLFKEDRVKDSFQIEYVFPSIVERKSVKTIDNK